MLLGVSHQGLFERNTNPRQIFDQRVRFKRLLVFGHGLEDRQRSFNRFVDGTGQAHDDAAGFALGGQVTDFSENVTQKVRVLECVAHQVSGQLFQGGPLAIVAAELGTGFGVQAIGHNCSNGSIGNRVVDFDQVHQLVAEHRQGGHLAVGVDVHVPVVAVANKPVCFQSVGIKEHHTLANQAGNLAQEGSHARQVGEPIDHGELVLRAVVVDSFCQPWRRRASG